MFIVILPWSRSGLLPEDDGTDISYRYPTEKMKQLYDINVHGAFFTAKEAARHMIPQKSGSIILVGSMSSSVR